MPAEKIWGCASCQTAPSSHAIAIYKIQNIPWRICHSAFLDFLQQEVRAPAARANQPQIALLSQLATPRAANTSHMVEKP